MTTDQERTVNIDGIEWLVYDGPMCPPDTLCLLINKAQLESPIYSGSWSWLGDEPRTGPAFDLMTFDMGDYGERLAWLRQMVPPSLPPLDLKSLIS